MSDVQIWAVILGVFVLIWHAINVWGRLRAAAVALQAQANGRRKEPMPIRPDSEKRQG